MNPSDAPAERSSSPASPSAVAGVWNGMIAVGKTPIAMILRMHRDDDEWVATADYPQQGRVAVPIKDVLFENGCLRFSNTSLGNYVGRLAADGQSIDGEYSGKAVTYPLLLRRGEPELTTPLRPQTPAPPFNYAIKPVFVAGPAGRLAGTLTMPDAGPIKTVALLIPGSGAMDRDETVFGHKPFWVLADHLSRHGYAVLRMDDRGVGESAGERARITVSDEVEDAAAALDFLHVHPGLRDRPVGLIGHSMGSTVGRILAGRRQDVDFFVSLAGAGLAMGEALVARECEDLARAGRGVDAVRSHGDFARALFQELCQRGFDEAIDSSQILALAAQHGAIETAAPNASAWVNRYNEAWFRSALQIDPGAALARLRAPFLALNGSLDRQVTSAANLAALGRCLDQAKHPDFELVELPGLNHLFQTCDSGDPFEYPIIEETFAPLALRTIVDWLDARFTAP
jgi:uncharacterized protein